MNTIALKLRASAMAEFKPFALQLATEGKDQNEIVSAFQLVMRRKVSDYYVKLPDNLGKLCENVLDESKKEDNRAEIVLYDLLKKNKVDFVFQYPIGPYRADFLLGENIVLEIDGPHHIKEKDDIRDKYMRKKGYEIIRIPLNLMISNPTFLIDELKIKLKGGQR